MADRLIWSSNMTKDYIRGLGDEEKHNMLVDRGYDPEMLDDIDNVIDQDDYMWQDDSDDFMNKIAPMINNQTYNYVLLLSDYGSRNVYAFKAEDILNGNIYSDADSIEIVDDGEGLVVKYIYEGHVNDAFRLYAIPEDPGEQADFVETIMPDAIVDFDYEDAQEIGTDDIRDILSDADALEMEIDADKLEQNGTRIKNTLTESVEVDECGSMFPQEEDLVEAASKNKPQLKTELDEIKSIYDEKGPQEFYEMTFDEFESKYPTFTKDVIKSFLKEVVGVSNNDYDDPELKDAWHGISDEDRPNDDSLKLYLIYPNDWPCLFDGAEKLATTNSSWQWEKIWKNYAKSLNEDVTDYNLPTSLTLSLTNDLDLDDDNNEIYGRPINDEDDFVGDVISDYLSDTYGFTHYGFNWEFDDADKDKVIVTNIEWDIDESLGEGKDCANCDESCSKDEGLTESKKLTESENDTITIKVDAYLDNPEEDINVIKTKFNIDAQYNEDEHYDNLTLTGTKEALIDYLTSDYYGFEEKDIEEFYPELLESLHEDANRSLNDRISSTSDDYKLTIDDWIESGKVSKEKGNIDKYLDIVKKGLHRVIFSGEVPDDDTDRRTKLEDEAFNKLSTYAKNKLDKSLKEDLNVVQLTPNDQAVNLRSLIKACWDGVDQFSMFASQLNEFGSQGALATVNGLINDFYIAIGGLEDELNAVDPKASAIDATDQVEAVVQVAPQVAQQMAQAPVAQQVVPVMLEKFTLDESEPLNEEALTERKSDFSYLTHSEKLQYVIDNFKKITGKNIKGAFNKGAESDEFIFNQDFIDATYDKIDSFLKKNGMSNKEVEDFIYDLDAELVNIAPQYIGESLSEDLEESSDDLKKEIEDKEIQKANNEVEKYRKEKVKNSLNPDPEDVIEETSQIDESLGDDDTFDPHFYESLLKLED